MQKLYCIQNNFILVRKWIQTQKTLQETKELQFKIYLGRSTCLEQKAYWVSCTANTGLKRARAQLGKPKNKHYRFFQIFTGIYRGPS